MEGRQEARQSAGWLLGVLAFGAIYFLLFVQILQRPWFQDDPGQFASLRSIDRPIRLFTDFDFARRFGSGKGVVPMQMLDYWVDIRLPAPMPWVGYLHSLLTSLAAVAVLFLVIRRVAVDPRLAFGGAVVWLLLPSTLSTCLFLATRHYVEGLALTGVVFLLAFSSRTMGIGRWTLLVLCAVAAMFCKEVYAGLVPAILIASGVRRRMAGSILLAVGLGLGYAAYRVAAVGGGLKYTMPLLGPAGYLKYLVTLPFGFSGTLLAYPLVAFVAWATFRFAREGGSSARRDLWTLAALLGVTMFMLYPVAYAVVNSYRQLGTWYRSPFVPNTIVLVWTVILIRRLAPTKGPLLLGLVGASILPGLLLSWRWWNVNMAQEAAEARFCRAYPDRLLFTDDPSTAYLEGIAAWYGPPQARVLMAEQWNPIAAEAAVRRYGTVWSYQNGAIAPDPRRAQDILHGITPAFRGRSPARPR